MRSNATNQTGLLITYSNADIRKQQQQREEKTGKKETLQAAGIELQEIVTTMDLVASRWSIVSV